MTVVCRGAFKFVKTFFFKHKLIAIIFQFNVRIVSGSHKEICMKLLSVVLHLQEELNIIYQ